jgi:hypothetical protein
VTTGADLLASFSLHLCQMIHQQYPVVCGTPVSTTMMSGLWGNAKEAHIVVPDAGFRSNGPLTRRGNIGMIAPCHPDDILLVGLCRVPPMDSTSPHHATNVGFSMKTDHMLWIGVLQQSVASMDFLFGRRVGSLYLCGSDPTDTINPNQATP